MSKQPRHPSPDQLPLWDDPGRSADASSSADFTDAPPLAAVPLPPLSASARLSELVPRFLDFCASIDRARHTRATLKTDLDLLTRFVGDRPAETIGLDDLRRYVAWLERERDNDARSLRRKVASVKAFFKWLRGEGARDDDPALKLIYPALRPLPPQVLEESEAERLLAAAERLPWRAVLLTLLDCGLKRDELLALHPTDIFISLERAENSHLTIRATKDARKVRARTLRLTPRLAECLHDYLAATPGELAFPISVRMVNVIVETCGARAGLSKRGPISPQMLRDTFALREIQQRVAVEDQRAREGLAPTDLSLLRSRHDQEVCELLGLNPGPLNDPIARYRALVPRSV